MYSGYVSVDQINDLDTYMNITTLQKLPKNNMKITIHNSVVILLKLLTVVKMIVMTVAKELYSMIDVKVKKYHVI